MSRLPWCLLLMAACLTGCAATPVQVDTPVLKSARLTFAKGLPPFPDTGYYLGVPGYVFVANEISMQPGNKRIFYACPGDWGWKSVTHFIPYVDQEFEANHTYELTCDDKGYPQIRQIR